MTTITHPQHDAHVVDQLADRLNQMLRARAAAKLPRYRTVLGRQLRLIVSDIVDATAAVCVVLGVGGIAAMMEVVR